MRGRVLTSVACSCVSTCVRVVLYVHSAYRALRREKRMLQLKLKTYEDEFQRLTGRKVRYHKDIRPVEAEYQRYKEVKAAIQELGGKSGSPDNSP